MPLQPGLIALVAYNMRARDRDEMAALGLGLDSTRLAERLALARYGFVACADDSTPIAACAGEEHLPGLVGWSFFATAHLPEIGLALTRHLRRITIPTLCEAGVRRAEARSLKGYDWAARWMASLGFRDLCVLKRFGAGGQDFILWELTDDDVRKSLLQPEATQAARAGAAPTAADHRQRGGANG